jgi:hypothetical protein
MSRVPPRRNAPHEYPQLGLQGVTVPKKARQEAERRRNEEAYLRYLAQLEQERKEREDRQIWLFERDYEMRSDLIFWRAADLFPTHSRPGVLATKHECASSLARIRMSQVVGCGDSQGLRPFSFFDADQRIFSERFKPSHSRSCASTLQGYLATNDTAAYKRQKQSKRVRNSLSCIHCHNASYTMIHILTLSFAAFKYEFAMETLRLLLHTHSAHHTCACTTGLNARNA